MNKLKKKIQDPAYYVTMYKLKGHETWRAQLSDRVDGFDKSWRNQTEGILPEITERNVLRIDRLTGTIKPI